MITGKLFGDVEVAPGRRIRITAVFTAESVLVTPEPEAAPEVEAFVPRSALTPPPADPSPASGPVPDPAPTPPAPVWRGRGRRSGSGAERRRGRLYRRPLSWAALDRLPDEKLHRVNIDALRQYAARHLGIAYASRMQGGRERLEAAIVLARRERREAATTRSTHNAVPENTP
jgi:hypothetical protein